MHTSNQYAAIVGLNGVLISRNRASYRQYDSTYSFNSSNAVRVLGCEYWATERFRFDDAFTSDNDSYSLSLVILHKLEFEGEYDIWCFEFVRESGMCREDVFWWSVR